MYSQAGNNFPKISDFLKCDAVSSGRNLPMSRTNVFHSSSSSLMLETIDLGHGNIGKFLRNYTASHLMTLIFTAVRSYSLRKEFPTV